MKTLIHYRVSIVIVLLSLCLYSNSLYGQSDFLTSIFGQSSFIASDNTEYSFHPYYDNNKMEYIISINHRFNEAGRDSYSLTSVSLKDVSSFKSDISLIWDKYNEWKQIAIDNGVNNFEKRIPIDFTSIESMWAQRPTYNYLNDYSCERYSQRDAIEIYPVFTVSNFQTNVTHYLLKIRLSFGYQGVYMMDEWLLTETDIEKLFNCLDIAIEKQRKQDNEAKETDELFH